MPFVKRDDKGVVDGIYATAQPGRADEFLPDDHPDVVSRKRPEAALSAEELAEVIIANPGRPITRADIDAKKASR